MLKHGKFFYCAHNFLNLYMSVALLVKAGFVTNGVGVVIRLERVLIA